MSLPADFQFSQGSLQDYVDCPRRFQLRYVQRLVWPALEVEPALENERYLQQGAVFHRLVHQHILGIPPERLSSTVTDEVLRRWWHNYLESGPSDLPPFRYPEVLVSAPVSGHRLVAKYDLVAVEPGQQAGFGESRLRRAQTSASSDFGELSRAVIVDWKTSRKRPRRKWLAERLQSRVYPYLLVRAGAHLNKDRSFEPGRVDMVYWFASFPARSERFTYDAAQYEADGAYLASLIEEIKGLGDDGWPLTDREGRCRYCPYRSLCQRGIRAGTLDEAEDTGEDVPELSGDFDFDFEQVAEIAY